MKKYIILITSLVAVGMCLCLQVKINNTDKNVNEIKELDLSTVEEYESTKSENEYYDKISEYDFSHINIASEEKYVNIDIDKNILDIDSNMQYVTSPEDISNVSNSDTVVVTYNLLENNDNVYVKVTSYNGDNTRESDVTHRKIDAISIFNVKNSTLNRCKLDGTVDDFIRNFGNPSYKYTETVKYKVYGDEEVTIQTFVYESDKYELELFSRDGIVIDKISMSVK